jgi:6-phosphofructokinase 1
MNTQPKTIAVLTGGGDVPGLNPCIKSLTLRATEAGMKVLGVRRGWAGLLNYDRDDPESFDRCFMWLDKKVVRTVDRSGGTFLHTSRTNPSRVSRAATPEFLKDQTPAEGEKADFTPHVLANLEALGVESLVPIGGDDTLSFGERLHQENFPVIAIPKTMDNDVYGTDYCIGFSTAVTRSVDFINQLRTSTGSHERIAVVELFGRYSGETSLISAYLSGADRALISEVPFDVERLAELVMRDKKDNPSHYAMVTVSEGATMVGGEMHLRGAEDAYGHRKLGGIGSATGEALKEITGENIINQQVSYLMRSGAPDSLDLMVAVNYADMAVGLAKRGRSGRLVSLSHGTYTDVPLATITAGQKRVDVKELYDVEAYRPTVRHVMGKPMFLY